MLPKLKLMSNKNYSKTWRANINKSNINKIPFRGNFCIVSMDSNDLFVVANKKELICFLNKI